MKKNRVQRKEGEQQNKYNGLPETIFQKPHRTDNHEKQVSEKLAAP